VSVNNNNLPSLYNWIQTQGKRYQGLEGYKPLSKEQIELLEQIDFEFLEYGQQLVWNEIYNELVKYQSEHGSFPTRHEDNPDLNRWMRRQRHSRRGMYGYAPLSEEQIALLENIDFPWLSEHGNERLWYKKYDELVQFQKEHGHFLVDREESPTFYNWIRTQRAKYKGTSPGRRRSQIYLLEQVDFPWTTDRYTIEWQSRYEELVQFWEKHGHSEVNAKEHTSLNSWSRDQRKRYHERLSENRIRSKIPEYQIQLLEKIDFRW